MHIDQRTLTGDFVWLRAGTLRVVLPRDVVGVPQYRAERPQPSGEPGLWLQPGETDGRRYAALSADLSLMAEIPAERFVIAPLAGSDVGFYWDELRVLIGVTLRLHTLPVTLVGPRTPVQAWVERGGELAYLASAERITEFALPVGEPA